MTRRSPFHVDFQTRRGAIGADDRLFYSPQSAALADAAPNDAAAGAAAVPSINAIVVTAERLNEARNGIQTQTGASTYVIDEAAIAAAPGGDNSLLNQVVMQAPDVARTPSANITCAANTTACNTA